MFLICFALFFIAANVNANMAWLSDAKLKDGNVTCSDKYKIFWVIKHDVSGFPKNGTELNLFSCSPDVKNNFCDGKGFVFERQCDSIPGSKDAFCKISPDNFDSYNAFANWKMHTSVYTVQTQNGVNLNIEHLIVTPLFRCPLIRLIKPSNPMFD